MGCCGSRASRTRSASRRCSGDSAHAAARGPPPATAGRPSCAARPSRPTAPCTTATCSRPATAACASSARRGIRRATRSAWRRRRGRCSAATNCCRGSRPTPASTSWARASASAVCPPTRARWSASRRWAPSISTRATASPVRFRWRRRSVGRSRVTTGGGSGCCAACATGRSPPTSCCSSSSVPAPTPASCPPSRRCRGTSTSCWSGARSWRSGARGRCGCAGRRYCVRRR